MRERSLPMPAVLPQVKTDPRPGRRWAFPAIFLLVLLSYFPALNGGLIWDDDRHVTKPELQSIEGLRRIWFELGATQQYYPVLHSAFWVEHRLWGDATSLVGIAGPGTDYVKRVIGIPGDHVACCNSKGQVTVNGVPLSESAYVYPGDVASALTR